MWVASAVLVACGPAPVAANAGTENAAGSTATAGAGTETSTSTTTETTPRDGAGESAPIARSHAPVFESGFAAWYGAALAGHKTASGERFDPALLTAAHRTLKLGTWLEVRRTDTGRAVRVKVNDRGPVSHRFVIDLSSGAARVLGMLKMGVAPVELRILPAR